MDEFQAVEARQVAEGELLDQLDLTSLPRHIAIIMDGNGRWAAQRGLPRIAGHKEGLRALQDVLEIGHELTIPYITIYAFSQENWKRPHSEIRLLMGLLEQYLHQERQRFQERQVRFLPIGRLEQLPPSVRSLALEVAEETRHLTQRTLAVALSYGGRAEIVDAVRKVAIEVQMGSLTPDQIDENLFEQYLSTWGLPDPDLLIRTSGEARISNFLPWQIAYTELYFTKTLWPDFRRVETLLALLDYQKRERRFGRITQTVSP
ncbi:isoprenyl transferase [Candidatus Nitrospira neomarina]|uniref:Isoprenyl transferase n=1 Tax=Candidatus Nitrospira neomarina TaxID=3020899 RepID=A0AA96GN60_9BACT|nr:isoprenyl transferase [Candidatus Nitrospira neomarina]WNM63947.1 isoprenyl transferase [Candidatus Nitrospira neomarina]